MSERSSLVESDFTVSYSIDLSSPIGYERIKLIPVYPILEKLVPLNLAEKAFKELIKGVLLFSIVKAVNRLPSTLAKEDGVTSRIYYFIMVKKFF